ncbi:VOC family protein [Solimonas soli]|uniref:VOC family protein n=1 Tax=Solimonas soli TaxID=413479 RepID=UPI0004AE5AF1|nr:VOC family protein [Solimonas soli]
MTPHAQSPIRQVAYGVDDLAAGIAHWAACAGIGPWTAFRKATIRGRRRGTATMDVAPSYRGELQIELIQSRSRSPSPYRHEDGRPRIGMHHLGWHSDDPARGIPLGEVLRPELGFHCQVLRGIARQHDPAHRRRAEFHAALARRRRSGARRLDMKNRIAVTSANSRPLQVPTAAANSAFGSDCSQ